MRTQLSFVSRVSGICLLILILSPIIASAQGTGTKVESEKVKIEQAASVRLEEAPGEAVRLNEKESEETLLAETIALLETASTSASSSDKTKINKVLEQLRNHRLHRENTSEAVSSQSKMPAAKRNAPITPSADEDPENQFSDKFPALEAIFLATSVKDLPYAYCLPDAPGILISPHTNSPQLVDANAFQVGDVLICPYTENFMVVPAEFQKAASSDKKKQYRPSGPNTNGSSLPKEKERTIPQTRKVTSVPETILPAYCLPDRPGLLHSPHRPPLIPTDAMMFKPGNILLCPGTWKLMVIPQDFKGVSQGSSGMKTPVQTDSPSQSASPSAK